MEALMKLNSLFVSSTAVAAVLAGSTLAAAQPGAFSEESKTGYWDRSVEAPAEVLELTVSTGYVQGIGQPRRGVSDLSGALGPGASLDLGVGYRPSARWMLGASGSYQFYSRAELDDDSLAHGATGRLDATYHFNPFARLDPWARAGVGYRMLHHRLSKGHDELLHGLQLLSVTTGLDVRMQRDVAFAPILGADLDLFLWDRTESVEAPRLNAFVYLGVQGRFDIGGPGGDETPRYASAQ